MKLNGVTSNFFIVAFFIVHPFFAAEKKIFSPEEVVLNFVATHYLSDHEVICTFAETSKDNNALMIATAKNRRITKLKYVCPSFHPLGQHVHKYGSAHCFAYQFEDLRNLVLGYFWLDNGKTKGKNKTFYRFIAPLPYNSMPLFNENRDMSFYGYGERKYKNMKHPQLKKKITAIMHYCSDGSTLPCAVQIDEKPLWEIDPLLSYPSLLMVLLAKSGKKIIVADEHYSITYMTFSFDDIIIPHDYKQRVEFSSGNSKTKQSFETFPDYIKEGIEKRYLKQPK